jgi:hypothetical protein
MEKARYHRRVNFFALCNLCCLLFVSVLQLFLFLRHKVGKKVRLILFDGFGCDCQIGVGVWTLRFQYSVRDNRLSL